MPTTRRATLADRDGLAELSTASVGADDYVPAFLEEFLRTGAVFVAEDEGRMVGMMVYHDVPDGSVWLHAARTLPEHRRRGVATSLMARCEALARRRRRTCLRLWASASNVASVAANTRYGFRERARFTRMRAAATPGEACDLQPVTLDAAAWAAFQRSPILRLSAGYVFHDFYFLRLDRPNARRLAGEGALWRIEAGAFALSAGYQVGPGRTVQIQPLSGDARALLEAAPTLAAIRGADRVETFLPHQEAVLSAARRAGFAPMEWGQEAILFEKRVSARRPRPSRSEGRPSARERGFASSPPRPGSAPPRLRGPRRRSQR